MDKNIKTDQSDERVYGREFKLAAVARLKAGESPSQLALELGVRRNLLYKWKQQVERKGEADAFQDRPGRPMQAREDELARLRRDNARLQMEVEILKKLRAYSAARRR